QLMGDGRCIKPLYLEKIGEMEYLMSKGIKKCKKDGAFLPIVRSDEENSMFNEITLNLTKGITDNPSLILGMACNPSTRRLEWIDGSKITYTKNELDVSFNCIAEDDRVYSSPYWDQWFSNSSTTSAPWTVLCVIATRKPPSTTTKSTTTPTTKWTTNTTVKENTTVDVKSTTGIPTTISVTTVESTSSTEESTTTPTTKWATITTVKPNVDCGEYDGIVDPADETKPCFKIFTDPMSWKDAQKKCEDDFGSLATINNAQENYFFWRSAVSINILDDMHIGAIQSSNNGIWKWIDGNKKVSDYNNFMKGFPMSGLGNCSGMLTESSTAQWINEDCDNQELPFLCRRSGYSSLPKDCSALVLEEGKAIRSPGFPSSDVPCEFMMIVDANSLVQLEILSFDANPDIDFLEIYEGAVGKNLLASLTGISASPTKYMTTSSNVMRANWKPNVNNRAAENRGFTVR
ncbi:hypothetical protein PFISCL1PPCAC_17692, partial [Pristionchus fissidentatus]